MSENMCTLEMKDISIEFPGVKALNNVNFTMRSGEIRAVVGANGAGKSTLMKVLAGANETYTGDIFIDSQHYELRTPRAAKDLGIELVYQEVDTALFPYLTVGENIMFNSIVTGMKGRAMIRWRKINKSARDILRQLNMDIDVTRKMSSLTLAQKQMVLIARAVREQCRFLILDEPTAPLSLGEVAELFRIVKELASKKNVGIMDGEGKVRDVSFSIRSGEIVGVCGLVGAGKTELCKLLFGANRMGAGTIRYKGKPISVHSPTSAVRQKIALVPEERRKEGVLVSEPVYFNLSAACLGKFANRFSFIVRSLEIANAKKLVGDLGIKTPSVYQRVKYLSGGNQQKVAVGKWLTSDSDIYMLDEPTKGVDVGAKRDIFQLIQSLAKQGKAVLYASSEINEILAITDRLYVMYNGEFVTELETHKTTEEEILYYATGGRK